VDDNVVSRHGACQGVEILGVASDDDEALVAGVMREVPFATRREVVIDRDLLGLGLGQEAVDEVAADEARPPDEKVPADAQSIDSQ
jgi:hypothetical protein